MGKEKGLQEVQSCAFKSLIKIKSYLVFLNNLLAAFNDTMAVRFMNQSDFVIIEKQYNFIIKKKQAKTDLTCLYAHKPIPNWTPRLMLSYIFIQIYLYLYLYLSLSPNRKIHSFVTCFNLSWILFWILICIYLYLCLERFHDCKCTILYRFWGGSRQDGRHCNQILLILYTFNTQ